MASNVPITIDTFAHICEREGETEIEAETQRERTVNPSRGANGANPSRVLKWLFPIYACALAPGLMRQGAREYRTSARYTLLTPTSLRAGDRGRNSLSTRPSCSCTDVWRARKPVARAQPLNKERGGKQSHVEPPSPSESLCSMAGPKHSRAAPLHIYRNLDLAPAIS